MSRSVSLPFKFPLSGDEIRRKRFSILEELMRIDEGFSCVPVRSLSRKACGALLSLYDAQFLGGVLKNTYATLDVTLSSRLTRSAGKFLYAVNAGKRFERAEIRMSSDFLFRLTEGPFHLNGLCADTPQEAFLIVFEHELCHALEMALYGASGHSKRFLSLANGLFGHTATRHSLPTRTQDAAKDGLIVGSRVSFPCEGRTLIGTVTYIGKTATVMVPSLRGEYRDRRGMRYAKYRVPIELLKT